MANEKDTGKKIENLEKKIDSLNKKISASTKKAVEDMSEPFDAMIDYSDELLRNLQRQKDLTEGISKLSRDQQDYASLITEYAREGNKELEREAILLERSAKFQIEQADAALDMLKTREKQIDLSDEQIKHEKEKLIIESRIKKLAEKYSEELEEQLEFLDEITHMVKSIPVVGGLLAKSFNFDKIKEEFSEKVIKSFDNPKAYKFDALKLGLRLALIGGLVMAIHRAVHLQEEIVDLGKAFGTSYKESYKMLSNLEAGVISSGIIGANVKEAVEAQMAYNNVLGTSTQLTKEQLQAQLFLTKQLGFSADESAIATQNAEATGVSLQQQFAGVESMVNEYNKFADDNVNVRNTTKQVLKLSNSLRAAYKNNAKELTMAVIQANKLGMSLERTSEISKGYLSIDESIQSEMEARVITGKNINLNEARLLSLQGKSAEAVASAVDGIGGYEELSRMLPFQQEALAKALNMSTDEMLQQAKMSKLGVKDMKELTDEKVKQLEAAQKITPEEAKQYLKQNQIAGIQERMASLSEKLLITFDKIFSGPLSKILDYLGQGVTFLENMIGGAEKFIEKILPAPMIDFLKKVGDIGKIALAVGAIASIVSLFKAAGKGVPVFITNQSGTGGSDIAAETGAPGGGMVKNLSKLGKSFKKGGMKGGMKSLSGFSKQALKGAGGKLGIIGALGSLGMNVAEDGFSLETLGRTGLTGLGSFLGAGLIGGPTLGAGAIGGGIAGGMAGDYLGDLIFGEKSQTPENDFIMRPGQDPISFNKDDIIIGGTSLLEGGTSTGNGELLAAVKEQNELLKQLISSVKQPTVIKMGSRTIEELDSQISLRKNINLAADSSYGTRI